MMLEKCRVLPSNKEDKKLNLVGIYIYMIIIYYDARSHEHKVMYYICAKTE